MSISILSTLSPGKGPSSMSTLPPGKGPYDDLFEDIEMLRYIGRGGLDRGVPKIATMLRKDLSRIETQTIETTESKGGGDCDDLALYTAYQLRKKNINNPNLEFGVMRGFLKRSEDQYDGHAVLAIRDKRFPNKYVLYEVTGSSPQYIGYFIRWGPNDEYPSPKYEDGRKYEDFILNVYVPVNVFGRFNFSSTTYFVPEVPLPKAKEWLKQHPEFPALWN